MAHFAKLDENNIVTQVIVVGNDQLLDVDNIEREELGIAFCQQLFGGTWKQTSYNNRFRVRYAGIGFTYNEELNAFIPPKPYPSWVLNNSTAAWDAPKPKPSGELLGRQYAWNESNQEWYDITPSDA
jgi:hypothetical protein